MADAEFEEFCKHFDQLPQHFKAQPQTYRLVHAITPLEEGKSFLEKVQLGGKLCGLNEDPKFFSNLWGVDQKKRPTVVSSLSGSPKPLTKNLSNSSDSDDEEIVTNAKNAIKWQDRPKQVKTVRRQKLLPSFTSKNLLPVDQADCNHLPWEPADKKKQKQQIPKTCPIEMKGSNSTSLMDELNQATNKPLMCHSKSKPTTLALNKAEDLEVEAPCDVDSGNSTNHSPDDGQHNLLTTSTTEGDFLFPRPLLTAKLELLEPTHRGLHRFVPRHSDEIEVDIGDPVYVQKEAEDLWCEGANLRTGQQGIFPLAHVVDVDYNDFDPNGRHDDCKERYLLEYLGSVESSLYKGNVVLCQAVRKILQSPVAPKSQRIVLEISDKGIKMIDKATSKASASTCHDYFYSLKNVTFCGFHPFDSKYFGFVSKHPRLPKYACHVFVGERSTQPVAEACGRAFQRFYQKFIDTAFPVEDIYLE